MIWGSDLVYRAGEGRRASRRRRYDMTVKRCATRSPEEFLCLVKQTYRVLPTRGLRDFSVAFTDRETRDFVLSHTEVLAGPGWRAPPFCAGARAAPRGPRGCLDRSLRTLLGTGPVEARCRGHEGAGGRGRGEDVTGSLLAARPAPTLRGSSAMRAGGTAAPGGRA